MIAHASSRLLPKVLRKMKINHPKTLFHSASKLISEAEMGPTSPKRKPGLCQARFMLEARGGLKNLKKLTGILVFRVLGCLGALLGCLGAVLGRLGSFLGPFWRSWGMCLAFGGFCLAFFGLFGALRWGLKCLFSSFCSMFGVFGQHRKNSPRKSGPSHFFPHLSPCPHATASGKRQGVKNAHFS